MDASRASTNPSSSIAGSWWRSQSCKTKRKSLSEDQHLEVNSASRAVAMAVTHEYLPRLTANANGSLSAMCLEDKFELLREIGDGSFGSVALARVRTAGAHIARRGTMVGVY